MSDEYIRKKDVVYLGVMMQTHLWTRKQTYNAIFCLPIADVAPVRHGRWINCEWVESGFKFWRCSECNHDDMNSRLHKYCPNCGAKMDEEETKE